LRRSHRVHFDNRRGNQLCGILEIPSSPPRGWMLFSHCFTCNKDLKAIVRLSRALSERGWGILRYDFAGLGASEGVFSETNFTTNCQDLHAAAEYLASEHHAPRFLIGHSFGGAASLNMAHELPSVVGVIALAAPSDTVHLADLLLSMNPQIATDGQGDVIIGGLTHRITQQMVDDFRSHALTSKIASLRKPVLVFHSPEDETVAFRHAKVIAGYDAANEDGMPQLSGDYPRSLVALPGSNHLLTSSDRDIAMIASIMDAWCERWI